MKKFFYEEISPNTVQIEIHENSKKTFTSTISLHDETDMIDLMTFLNKLSEENDFVIQPTINRLIFD